MFNDYQIDENYFNNNFKAGEWECAITKVEEKISKKNNPMLALSFMIDEQGTLYYYIVDDVSSEDAWRRRNQNLTRFFDCFSIQRGDFNYSSWIGKRGIIKIDKRAPNENGEQKGFEVKALIVRSKYSKTIITELIRSKAIQRLIAPRTQNKDNHNPNMRKDKDRHLLIDSNAMVKQPRKMVISKNRRRIKERCRRIHSLLLPILKILTIYRFNW